MGNVRHVLITGANKGIGKATVAKALEHSDVFVFLGSRNAERGEAAKAELAASEGFGDRIEVVPLDVSKSSSVRAAAELVRERLGAAKLYGVVNNAGIGLGSAEMETVLNVNTRGTRRVCEAFLPLLQDDGRIVNISSASGPMFVAGCSPERTEQFTDPNVSWSDVEQLMEECLSIEAEAQDFEEEGFGGGDAYGLSKACVNALTIELAREHPNLLVNACTPGFIETDLTRPFAKSRGVDPAEMGMLQPEDGTRAAMHLLFGEPGGSGWYFGSDAVRSPLDAYRSPGDPPYTGE